MRIYKGSQITLKLYTRINCQSIEADKMRVVLFTTNPNNSYIVNNVVVSGDTLLVTVGRNDLNTMEDGVINYIILGYDDNEEIYNSTRQSNYYLKTPDGYVAKSIQTSKDVYIVDNGDYKILPDEDYSSIEEVNVYVEFDAEPYIQRGIELGEENQKSKLESVSITENGTYTREDGYNEIHVEVPDLNGDYNEGYNEGYEAGIDYASENAGEIAAQTARVLDVTENGIYLSQYSELIYPDIITGVYPDGTEFYNYAELNSKVFNTNITPTPETRLELWYKGDDIRTADAWNMIIGAGKYDDKNVYQVRYYSTYNSRINIEVGNSTLNYDWDENAWHHILIAKEIEDASFMSLWVDEVKVGDFGNVPFTPNSTFYINGIENDLGKKGRKANGWFGMIKIDDTVIIPTADGFFNTNTGELLEVAEGGSYIFTDNTPKIPEGNLIKTVNVNVIPSIKFVDYGLKCSYTTFKTLPSWIDLNGAGDCSYMFLDSKIEEVPYFDTSNTTNMAKMFQNCLYITEVPLYDTKNCKNFTGMFTNAKKLQTIPNFEIGTDVELSEFVYGCTSLTSFPQLDTKGVTNMQSMFYNCTSLTEIPALDASSINISKFNSASLFSYFELTNITKAGGLLNLRRKIDDNYGWVKTPNLDYESCINILNGLYDFVGNNETPSSNEGKLKVHQNFLNLVGDEISIGLSKGWSISA